MSGTDKKLGFGLNTRGEQQQDNNNNNAKKKGKKKSKNVLDEGLSSSEDDGEKSDCKDESNKIEKTTYHRSEVNKSIAEEQAAMQKRAAAAVSLATEENVYDYDGVYDSEKQQQQDVKMSNNDKDSSEKKSSRYIGDLIKAADVRKREREIVLERKIARELKSEEEVDDTVKGKEKFITAAYKRKLQERELWQESEAKRLKEEEENDVTKQAGVAISNFYGNLNKNVAMGVAADSDQNEQSKDIIEAEGETERPILGFLEGFARTEDTETPNDDVKLKETDTEKRDDTAQPGNDECADEKITMDKVEANKESNAERQLRLRKIREEKVKQARIRYFQRHETTSDQDCGARGSMLQKA